MRSLRSSVGTLQMSSRLCRSPPAPTGSRICPAAAVLSFATNFSIGSYKYASFSFGPMPATFPAIVGQGTTHWSLYGTLTTP